MALQAALSSLTKKKVLLTVNKNRSTMIRVLAKKFRSIHLSIHQMFLESTEVEIKALAKLITQKKDSTTTAILHDFIDKKSPHYLTLNPPNKQNFQTQGDEHHLKELYDKVNDTYFQGSLNLSITWFGKKDHSPKRQITFGLYHDSMQLIKIHRLLDWTHVPSLFVEYVIFHEMLHKLHRPQITASGRRSIHTREFKAHEKKFLFYKQAKLFEKKIKQQIFK